MKKGAYAPFFYDDMNRLLPASAWLLVMVLAMSWLSPNHYAPWTAFHSELWSACSMLSIAVVVIHRCRDVLCFPPSLVVVFFALTQVFLGWCSGLIVAGGIAWMSGLYLVGLAGVICLGAIWQSHADGEAAEFLFAAVVLSALVSVVLQVFQLVMPAIDAFWFNPAPRGLRMDANLAQPNNLASLQLMGLIGCSWLWFRKKITTNLALLCAFILVAGLVLTGSRTGLIGGFVILIAYPSFLARQPLRSQATFIASLLGIWCVVL